MGEVSKTPIGPPHFYEYAGGDRCGICSQHRFIVVERRIGTFIMHTTVGSAPHRFLHAWRTRRLDPPCLAAYRVVKPVPTVANPGMINPVTKKQVFIDEGPLMPESGPPPDWDDNLTFSASTSWLTSDPL